MTLKGSGMTELLGLSFVAWGKPNLCPQVPGWTTARPRGGADEDVLSPWGDLRRSVSSTCHGGQGRRG